MFQHGIKQSSSVEKNGVRKQVTTLMFKSVLKKDDFLQNSDEQSRVTLI